MLGYLSARTRPFLAAKPIPLERPMKHKVKKRYGKKKRRKQS